MSILQSAKNLFVQDGFLAGDRVNQITDICAEHPTWSKILKVLYDTAPGIVLDTWDVSGQNQYEKILKIMEGDEAAGIKEASESLQILRFWKSLGALNKKNENDSSGRAA